RQRERQATARTRADEDRITHLFAFGANHSDGVAIRGVLSFHAIASSFENLHRTHAPALGAVFVALGAGLLTPPCARRGSPDPAATLALGAGLLRSARFSLRSARVS